MSNAAPSFIPFSMNDPRPRDRAYYEELAADARRRMSADGMSRRQRDVAMADLGTAIRRLAELDGRR